jgi:TonB family protein
MSASLIADSQVSEQQMMELSQKRTAVPRTGISSGSQESRLLIALAILLVTLAAVLVKDRQFWFGSSSTISDANEAQTTTPAPAPVATQAAAKQATPAPAPEHIVKKQPAPAAAPTQPKAAETPGVSVNRTVLPPLNVEVVAGDKHQNLHPGSNATKLQIAKPASPAAHQAAPAAPAVNAAQRERLAEAVPPSYPALAQHMNVQGSVVLVALIGADGSIQNLRVMSGPTILASAAQAAVNQWHFKPVLQNGQAVETRATITVNFTIKVNDSSPNTTIADGRDSLVITQQ